MAAPDNDGIKIPTSGDRRSTSDLAANILREATESTGVTIPGAAKWRSKYRAPFAEMTRASVDAKTSLRIAEQGLEATHARMVHTVNGVDVPVNHWRRDRTSGSLADTVVVEGRGDRVEQLEVPYRGELLTGEHLSAQLAGWADRGIIEPGFADAIQTVINNPQWLSLPGREVTLIGAGAAMGPLETLSRWGADIVAVDLPVDGVWDRVRAVAEQGAGTLSAPLVGAIPGAHIATDLGVLRDWLLKRWTGREEVPVLGIYPYADGAAHVEAVTAADVLAVDLIDHRWDGALAFLNTPTDSFLVPPGAVASSHERWNNLLFSGRVHKSMSLVSARRLFAQAYPDELIDDAGNSWGLIDTTVSVQGPNYALAKRIQRWRAISAAEEGVRVSTTVAPASWTASVTKNKALASVYSAAHMFGVEIFEPETIAPLLAAKLVADVNSTAPTMPGHPEQLFSEAAAHGGLWRQPFEPGSALWLAGLIGALKPNRG